MYLASAFDQLAFLRPHQIQYGDFQIMSEAFLVYMLFYIAHFYFSHPACRAQIWFPIQHSMQDQELAQQGIMQNANRILTVFRKVNMPLVDRTIDFQYMEA